MNYTSNTEQIVFLKDRDIVQNLSAHNADNVEVTHNGVASYDFVKNVYDSALLSTTNLCTEISNLDNYVNDNYIHISGDINIGALEISGEVKIDNELTVTKDIQIEQTVKTPLIELKDTHELDQIHIRVSNDSLCTEFSLPEKSGKLITTETVSELSDFLSNEIALNDSDISELFSNVEFLSSEVSSNNNDIKDIYLSVNQLCGQILSNDDDIEEISTNIQIHLDNGMLYKGDLSVIDPSKTYSTLSDYFHDNVTDEHEYMFKLGDMYRFSVDVNTLDGLTFNKNDYIIINKNITLQHITSADINIIKDDTYEIIELCGNYDNFVNAVDLSVANICSEISVNTQDIDDLYLSATNLQTQIASNDDDILSITISVDNLCSEISDLEHELCSTITDNYVHVSGDIIVGKLEVQNEIIATNSISSETNIYAKTKLQVGQYDDDEPIAYEGNKIEVDSKTIIVTEKTSGTSANKSTYEFPGKSGKFALISDINETSSSLCSTISTDIDFLSGEVSENKRNTILSVENLCGEISATNINVNTLESNFNALSTEYNNTFCSNDSIATGHTDSNNLIITDPNDSDPSGGHKHDKYYLSFEKGTLVLIPLK